MATAEKTQDAELEQMLATMAAEGRLTDYVVDLLAQADRPDIEINGVALAAPNPPISDKSCYKKCLKEDIRNPGSYRKCIRKCRPKLSVEVAPVIP